MSVDDARGLAEETILNDAVVNEIRARLDVVLGDARLPTALPVAHALAEMFLFEARQQGRQIAEQAWKALDIPAIAELGRQFTQLMARGGPDANLPAGTTMMARLPGTIFVGDEQLGLDVDRPGLHPIDDLPIRPGGSNLALLLDTIEELRRGLPCGAIGMPTLVERMEDRYLRPFLQFEPFELAGGAVLQRSMDFPSAGYYFCGLPRDEVLDIAADIIKSLRALWAAKAEIAERVASIRQTATRMASRFRDVDVHAITVELESIGFVKPLTYGVQFGAWDHALRRGVIVQEIGDTFNAKQVLSQSQLDWADEAERVHMAGAHGRIEGLAQAIVEAAPQGAQAVLADLADRFETHFLLPTPLGPRRCRLYWWCGVIRADLDSFNGISVWNSTVEIRNFAVPETVAVALRGKPLHVVFDQPFRCGSPIESIDQGSWISIKTEPDHWLVNCGTGRMWRE